MRPKSRQETSPAERKEFRNLREGVKHLTERLIINAGSSRNSTKISASRKAIDVDTAQMAIDLMLDFSIQPNVETRSHTVIRNHGGSVSDYLISSGGSL